MKNSGIVEEVIDNIITHIGININRSNKDE